jgi:hypothetical protein
MRVLYAYVRQRDADARMDRTCRGGGYWADLVGRRDDQVGPHEQPGNEEVDPQTFPGRPAGGNGE